MFHGPFYYSNRVTEAHSSYGIQLDEAKKVASSLQMLLKDTERRGDEFRTRCHFAEQAATQYKAERDALLTMVSKLHLTPQADPAAASAPTPVAVQHNTPLRASTENIVSQMAYAPQLAPIVTAAPAPVPVPANLSSSGSASAAHTPSALTMHPSSSSSHDHASLLSRHSEQAAPTHPAAPKGIAVVPFLTRSEDFAVRQGLSVSNTPELAALVEVPAAHVEDADSSLEVCSDEEDEVLRPDSATGSVLDMAGRLHSQSLEGGLHGVEVPAPQFVSHSSRVRGVSLQGMLAASNDTALSKKPSSARRLRSASSSEGHAIQKSKSKSKSPTAAAGSAKKAASARLPAPAVGQPGKSMVIRKPPSYTGASNEIVRGSASPIEAKNKVKVQSAGSAKGSSKKGPSAKATPKAHKVAAPRATPDALNELNQPVPVSELKVGTLMLSQIVRM